MFLVYGITRKEYKMRHERDDDLKIRRSKEWLDAEWCELELVREARLDVTRADVLRSDIGFMDEELFDNRCPVCGYLDCLCLK